MNQKTRDIERETNLPRQITKNNQVLKIKEAWVRIIIEGGKKEESESKTNNEDGNSEEPKIRSPLLQSKNKPKLNQKERHPKIRERAQETVNQK